MLKNAPYFSNNDPMPAASPGRRRFTQVEAEQPGSRHSRRRPLCRSPRVPLGESSPLPRTARCRVPMADGSSVATARPQQPDRRSAVELPFKNYGMINRASV
ncbi:MAG: hypothetical protein ACLSAH_06755 [Bilophila wadsworthia]